MTKRIFLFVGLIFLMTACTEDRDLLGEERPELRKRIEKEGWGKQFDLPGPMEIRYSPGPGLFSMGRGEVRPSDGSCFPGFIQKKNERWSLECTGQIFRADSL